MTQRGLAPPLEIKAISWMSARFAFLRSWVAILMERDANATFLPPDHGARMYLLLGQNDEGKLVGNSAMRPNVQCGAGIGQIADNAADGHVAEPD
jgi:hypothetical protein